jgi:hypothetical protein
VLHLVLELWPHQQHDKVTSQSKDGRRKFLSSIQDCKVGIQPMGHAGRDHRTLGIAQYGVGAFAILLRKWLCTQTNRSMEKGSYRPHNIESHTIRIQWLQGKEVHCIEGAVQHYEF